ncbi:uncharacterized protein LOC127473544 isoform X11 [Manacus candei]|uniref:uncharacterized protein LOC127473544 isoform X11 n=1 Tax=Manacus candei TaxID=415023 RepID=UPI00222807B5|nr:uncharacterized protein LOC127473544 isoform X11 [Manacus candei]
MALALRLFLPFLLAVALHARAAQAAPVPARGADENTGNASPLDWLRKVLQPLQPPAGVFAGRTFPAPLLVPRPKLLSHGTGPPRGKSQPPGEKKTHENTGNASPLDWLRKVLGPLQPAARVSAGRTFPAPLLVAPPKPASHGRGPPRGKSQPPGEKKTHESNEVLKEIMKELQKGREMDQGALWQAAFPEGSSGSVPGSAEGREEMPGTGTRDAAGATTRALKIQESIGRGFCSGARCLAVIMASVLGWQLVIMLCCAGIWYWWERKRLLSAPAPAQPVTSVRRKQISHLSSPSLYPAMLPQLQNLQVQEPPKRAPLPLSPLALHSNQI